MVGNANNERQSISPVNDETPRMSEAVADTSSSRFQERQIKPEMAGKENEGTQGQAFTVHGWWDAEPAVGRVVNGLPGRVDRIRALGNSIVPQVAEVIFRALVQTGQTQK